MRIAQIAPLYEPVPSRLYGGTERVVAHLADELVGRGHEVVLFASEESKTTAQLVPCRSVALRLDTRLSWDIPAHLSMLAEVRKLPTISRFCISTLIAFIFLFFTTWSNAR